MLNEEIKKHKETRRQQAIESIELSARKAVENYYEPSVKRLLVGSAEFPRSKAYAAALMPLFPNALKLGEIAERVDVPHSTLKGWRIEKKFREVVDNVCRSIASDMVRKLDPHVDFMEKGWIGEEYHQKPPPPKEAIQIIGILPFLNPRVVRVFLSLVMKRIDEGKLHYLWVLYGLEREFEVYDEKSHREFESRPDILLSTKILIRHQIELLLKGIPSLSADLIKHAQNTKEFIFNKLDLLAGGGERYKDSRDLLGNNESQEG